VRPEGGYQNERDYAGQQNKLRPNREPARCMFPGEFVAILRRHMQPRFDSCGVAMTRHGNQPRECFGLDEHGTIWFSKPTERRWLEAIPAHCIPYSTIRTARWDEEKLRWVDGTLKRGWRSALCTLIKTGYLRSSEELSHLIGQDSRKLEPIICRR